MDVTHVAVVFGYVWKIEPVAAMTEDEVVSAIAPKIQRYIEGGLSTSQVPPVWESPDGSSGSASTSFGSSR